MALIYKNNLAVNDPRKANTRAGSEGCGAGLQAPLSLFEAPILATVFPSVPHADILQ